MKDRTRKLIFFSAVLTFLITTPIIIFYARGYRINWNKLKIIKTGAIHANSTSKGANIYINGEYQGTTPFLVKELVPGDYAIKIQTDNTYPWTKTLTVSASQVVTTGDTLLIPQKITTTNIIPTENIANYWPTEDWKKIAFVDTASQLWLYTKSTQQLKQIKATTTPATTILWSVANNKLLLESNGIYVYDIKGDNFTKIVIPKDKLATTTISHLKWSQEDENKIFFMNDNTLYEFDYISSELKSPLDQKILVYEIINNQIYYLLESNRIFYRINTQGENKTQISLKYVDIDADAKLHIDNNQAAITDKGKVFLFDNKERLFSQIDSNTKNIEISGAGDKILLQKEQELFVYHINEEKDNKEFITRYGQTIDDCLWLTTDNHIIFSLGNQLKITETDTRNHLNIFDLVTFNTEAPVKLDTKTSELYFITEKGLEKYKILE